MRYSPWKGIKPFCYEYMNNPIIEPPAGDTLRLVEGKSLELILWRSDRFIEGQYQAELVVLFADTDVPVHCHPHVDSREYHLAGRGDVYIKGRKHRLRTVPEARLKNRASQILAGVEHWGRADTHNAFLSLQYWVRSSAAFITDDWQSAHPWK